MGKQSSFPAASGKLSGGLTVERAAPLFAAVPRLISTIAFCLAAAGLAAGVPDLQAGGRTFDAELSGFQYPRPVRYYQFRSQDQELRMAFMLAEPEHGNGRTVVLLHGKNFTAAYWEPTIRRLVEAGFRVVAPDQIGFGKSSKPHAYQFTFQALADNTRGLLDHLGIGRVALVGHSMGGMLATRFALMYPDRTEALALVDPIGLEDWKTMVPYRTIDQFYADELKATPASIREYERTSYFGGRWKADYEPLIEIPAGWTKDPDYPKVAWDSALTYDMIFTQPVLYEFPLLKVRTLLIIGQRDRTALGKGWASPEVRARLGNYPVLGREAARAIPGCELVEIPGAGHLPQVEAFGQYIGALLKFLGASG